MTEINAETEPDRVADENQKNPGGLLLTIRLLWQFLPVNLLGFLRVFMG
jgi:hypothetical protein